MRHAAMKTVRGFAFRFEILFPRQFLVYISPWSVGGDGYAHQFFRSWTLPCTHVEDAWD